MPVVIRNFLMLRGPITRNIAVFFASMIPFFENKGGIILAASMNIRWYLAYLVTSVASICQVSVLLRLERGAIDACKRVPILAKILKSVEKFTEDHEEFLNRHGVIALALVVSIPITGIGCLEASMLAELLHFNRKHATIAIFIGIILSGFMTTASVYGLLVAIRTLFG